jgi:RNA-directed DNA polymerase
MTGISNRENVYTKQRRIAELAKQMPEAGMHSLSYHMDLGWMREAYRRTPKDKAPGVDGQTGREYEENLEQNLASLLDRAKEGDTYRAPPVRRVYIPKEGKRGEKRPIGIPTFEDKVLQRAVVMLLEPLYEQDFLDCSYGFRPKRSQHEALEAVRNQIMDNGCTTILEIDIRKYFDTVDRGKLRELYRRRIRDGVVLRLIGKWLKAGVLEEDRRWYPEAGTPQGGVISPLLANIYLHYVLDRWFEKEVRPRLRGRAFLVRFADDAILGFSNPRDARRVEQALEKRFAKYGLTLHPDKTRVIRFDRPRGNKPSREDKGRSFDFLGFTHYWGKSRKGNWVVKQKTAKDRLQRSIRRVYQWCRANRHWKIKEQHRKLAQKLRGHYQYYGVTGNGRALSVFREQVKWIWRKWLSRRSQKRPKGNWFDRIKARYPLPQPRIAHSYVT